MNIYTSWGHNNNMKLEANRFRFSKDKTQLFAHVGRHNGVNMGLRTRPKYKTYFPGPYIYIYIY